MFDSGWAPGLDEAQLAAATHGDGPLIGLAGAGTGKTRTLVSRVAALIDRGADPERVLLLTFTRRAAEEMLARAATICDRRDAARKLWGGTFTRSPTAWSRRTPKASGCPRPCRFWIPAMLGS
jgi:DNA helicase-2/ATP-dependent DNA helicase PcrA